MDWIFPDERHRHEESVCEWRSRNHRVEHGRRGARRSLERGRPHHSFRSQTPRLFPSFPPPEGRRRPLRNSKRERSHIAGRKRCPAGRRCFTSTQIAPTHSMTHRSWRFGSARESEKSWSRAARFRTTSRPGIWFITAPETSWRCLRSKTPGGEGLARGGNGRRQVQWRRRRTLCGFQQRHVGLPAGQRHRGGAKHIGLGGSQRSFDATESPAARLRRGTRGQNCRRMASPSPS